MVYIVYYNVTIMVERTTRSNPRTQTSGFKKNTSIKQQTLMTPTFATQLALKPKSISACSKSLFLCTLALAVMPIFSNVSMNFT